MAKQFFYISMGVLALVVVWAFGAQPTAAGDADYAHRFVCGDKLWWFTEAGEAYELARAGEWSRKEDLDLPISTSEVVATSARLGSLGLASFTMLTNKGEVWAWNLIREDPFSQHTIKAWVNCGNPSTAQDHPDK